MLFKKSACGYIVVGLGNPGKKYENTPHNAGFMAIDYIADKLNCKITRSKFDALTATTELFGEKVFLMKPQTFMNLSGNAIRKAADFYKIPPENIIVIYDDIAIMPGKLRIRLQGSAGGHNGIKSIISNIGDTFPRIKIGVGDRRGNESGLVDFVIGNFSSRDKKEMVSRFDDIFLATQDIIKGESNLAMNKFNG